MIKYLYSLIALIGLSALSYAQSFNASQIKLRNDIKSFIQEEGFLPSIDKDGDISFKKEGRTYWVSISPDDKNPMFVVLGASFNKPEKYELTTLLLASADINYYPGVKMVCDEDSFTLQGELYLSQVEVFKYAFYTILNQIESVLSDLPEILEKEKTGVSNNSSSYSGSSRQAIDSNPKVVSYPSIRTKGDNKLTFKKVTITDSYTILEMSTNNNRGNTYYQWCQLSKNTHLICGGKNYSLVRAEGIELAPEKTYFSGSNSTISFTLYFQPIPKSATSFDFYEESGSAWNTWGISLSSSTSSSGTISSNSSNIKRTGRIESVTTEHNVYKDGIKGMKIHVKFSVQNCKGESCRCIAYFYYGDGNKMKAKIDMYSDQGGNLSTAEDFTPGYDNTSYNDLILWIPNSELTMRKSGKEDCYFVVQLYDFDIKSFIDASYKVTFTLG